MSSLRKEETKNLATHASAFPWLINQIIHSTYLEGTEMQPITKKYQRTAFLMENAGLGQQCNPLKTRQQAPNSVIYAKTHLTKPRLNFITFQLSQKWSGFGLFLLENNRAHDFQYFFQAFQGSKVTPWLSFQQWVFFLQGQRCSWCPLWLLISAEDGKFGFQSFQKGAYARNICSHVACGVSLHVWQTVEYKLLDFSALPVKLAVLL